MTMTLRPVRPLAVPPAGSGLTSVPGRTGDLPLIGDMVRYLTDPTAYLRALYAEHGSVAWRSAVGRKIVALLGPEAAQIVQDNKNKDFAHGPGYDPIIGQIFGNSVMLMDFDEHLFHKRIMQLAFGRPQLTSYLDGMNTAIETHVGDWQRERAMEISPAFHRLALTIATRTFLGAELGAQADAMGEAFQNCVFALSSPIRLRVPGHSVRVPGLGAHLPGTAWSRGLASRAFLEREIRSMIPAKRAGQDKDLFSELCRATTEDGATYTDDDIVNHMIFLMFAAHDTSTATMTTMAYHLAKHPEWQQRCREESLALGAHASYDDIQQRMPALDLVMKESLRLTPPVPQLFRAAVRDTEVLGHYIPKGTVVAVLPQFGHLMSEYWSDPERFDPERFAEPRREDKSHRLAWMPFGSGVHKCIGMHFAGLEIKATMHQMLRSFEWSVPAGYRMRMSATGMPHARDGLPVRIGSVPSGSAVRATG